MVVVLPSARAARFVAGRKRESCTAVATYVPAVDRSRTAGSSLERQRRMEVTMSVMLGTLSIADAADRVGVSADEVADWVSRFSALPHQLLRDSSA